jgi:hypothetical protein
MSWKIPDRSVESQLQWQQLTREQQLTTVLKASQVISPDGVTAAEQKCTEMHFFDNNNQSKNSFLHVCRCMLINTQCIVQKYSVLALHACICPYAGFACVWSWCQSSTPTAATGPAATNCLNTCFTANIASRTVKGRVCPMSSTTGVSNCYKHNYPYAK